MLFDCHPKILHKHCFQFLLGVKTAPRETENNAYAKFWGEKQRALWYVMIFSGVANNGQNEGSEFIFAQPKFYLVQVMLILAHHGVASPRK